MVSLKKRLYNSFEELGKIKKYKLIKNGIVKQNYD